MKTNPVNKNNCIKAIILILFLFININAAVTADISGVVLDGETAEPIISAAVQILEKKIFTTSGLDGKFSFTGLEPGKYTLKLTHLSYQEKLVDIIVDDNTTRNIVIYLTAKSIAIDPVVVTDRQSKSKFDEFDELKNVLKGKELQRDQSLSIASTLKNETGLSVRSMGPAPARPVIRGLGGDRVSISEDDISSSDLSATSPDHAVTAEPFTVDRIEVIRGPKILLQNSTTIGGIVNIVREEVPVTLPDQIHGNAGLYGETANRGYLGALVLQIPVKPFSLRLEGTNRKANDLNTPAGKLKNSYLHTTNYSGGISLIKDWGFIGGSFRNFNSDYGIPGGFIGAHPNGVNIEMSKQHFNVKGELIFNSNHFSNLEASFNRTFYNHIELEASGLIGAEFAITTHQGFLNINTKDIWIFDNGTIGASFEARDFKIGGFVFTPFTTSLKISSYLYQTLKLGKLNFEVGARYSFDDLNPKKTTVTSRDNFIVPRNFNSLSASFSAMYELTENLFIGGNISRSTRVPTIEELYSEGPHLAAYSYEIGNPNLPLEKGIGTEAFVFYRKKDLFFNLTLFMNDLSSYIIHRNSGDTAYSVFLPIFVTRGVEAIFYGAESLFEYNLTSSISISSNFSYTYGNLKENNSPLPSIPPIKNVTGLKYSNNDLIIGGSIISAASQKRVDIFEEPTAGYVIFDLFGQYSLLTGDYIHNISLTVENIFNKEYRNHLSRIKSILPESGRNFRLTYKFYF